VLLNKVKISCGLFWVDLVKLMESDPIYVPLDDMLRLTRDDEAWEAGHLCC
jgi:hypothetical protein